MIFEHFALNISNPLEFVDWYTTNLEMRIAKAMKAPPFTHFLTDSSGRTIIEIYSNPSAYIADYNKKHPLEFHFAFTADNVVMVKEKLISAGAKLVEDVILEDGSHLVMLRDPFGIPLQLCKRANPLP
ncbi:MAG: VOC family protein [Ignavibacteriaceae bacterium]|nr:VOC family protein [Ignavibacteriaceae bacterium]